MPLYQGYPAKRALSAMRKHGGKGPFGRMPSYIISLFLTATLHHLNQWASSLMVPYQVTRPQWVNEANFAQIKAGHVFTEAICETRAG